MNYSKIAKQLGRRGGLKRAKTLSKERRREIASMGAKARVESKLLAERIRSNFVHAEFVSRLRSSTKVFSAKKCYDKLPEIHK